jgi:hypothetical protein
MMRTMMTMAAVGMALAWSATGGWSETLNLQKAAKGQATLKAASVNTLGSSLESSLGVGRAPAEAIKDSAVNQTLKSGQSSASSSAPTLDARHAGLASRKGSPNQFASTGEKPAELQSFAASGLAKTGLGSSSPALKAEMVKEQGLVNKLR